MRYFKVFSVLIVALYLLMQADSAYAIKVGATPSSVTLDEGASQVVQLRLDQPIIVQSGDPHVVISIVSDDPARVSVSSSPVSFGVNEWFTVKTFTLNAVDNSTYDTPDSVVVRLTVASGSVYYDGFTNTINVQINEDDPSISPSTSHSGNSRLRSVLRQKIHETQESIKTGAELVVNEMGQKLSTSYPLIRLGMTDIIIKEIQVYLNTHGYPVSLSGTGSLGNETFYFGPRTQAAVILFQKATGIIPDGIVGSLTLDAMNL